jgi:hypothetical protein
VPTSRFKEKRFPFGKKIGGASSALGGTNIDSGDMGHQTLARNWFNPVSGHANRPSTDMKPLQRVEEDRNRKTAQLWRCSSGTDS